MSQVYEEDALDAGKNQVIIRNDNAKVIIVPELGGRIADVQFNDDRGGFETRPYLYRTYPEGVDFGPYTEYGGIEECIGGAPGSLWNAAWRWERKDDGVLLQALSKSILVRKHIFLDEAESVIKIDYSFLNFGTNFSKFTFGIHPEVCIGGSLRDNRYYVPTSRELLNGGYVEPGFKNKILPSEGWCAITCEGQVLGQMFPEGVIDTVEIYYPRVDTHIVLEPIIFGVGVSPDRYAGFTYMVYMGDGDAGKIREMRASREAEFLAKYEPFDRDELPEDVMAELGEMARAQAEPEFRPGPDFRVAFHPGRLPQIPDVGAIVRKAVENIPGAMHVKANIGDGIVWKADVDGIAMKTDDSAASKAETEGTGRTEDLPPDTEISIEHVKGNVTIHGWERSYIEYADMRGTIDQREGVVRIEASGDYSLKVPRATPKISLDFVNGNVALFDVASSVKISGVKGEIGVVSAEVPEDGTLDISLVVGDINLSIPGNSSCSISATSLAGGEITCDLPLLEEERTRTQLSGVLNDGTARILLNTTKGRISVSQVLDA